MNYENFKWYIWTSRIGLTVRRAGDWTGYNLIKIGRKMLRWSHTGRCSWCGKYCGIDSIISKKGIRCWSIEDNCWEKP
jgi:hypothetical protein